MKILENYLDYISEETNRNLNAPELAYYTLYDKYPESRLLRGRTHDHPAKYSQHIEIDEGIPDKAFRELLSIKKIEMRSSCQGESEIRPSFVIFRPINQKEDYVKKFVDNLNKQKDIKAQYDIGKGGKYRICVTWKTWYGKKGNENWWLLLPKKIKASIP